MNRIASLENDLRRGTESLRTRRRGTAPATRSNGGTPAAPPTPARQDVPGAPTAKAGPATVPATAPVTAQSVAAAMSAWQGTPARRRRRPARSVMQSTRSRAFSTLDYRVPDLPMPIQQTSSQVCWAYVATMMAEWRDRRSFTPETYLAGLGEPWVGKLASNTGLSADEAPQFLATMGIQIEPAQASFTAERWEQMLRDWGPIWVTTDINPAPGIQGPHAHILVGIHGPSDGDPNVDVFDPWTGRELSMPLSQFDAMYGQLAATPFAGRQIRHWPANAQRAAQQSLMWARQESTRDTRSRGLQAAVAIAGLGWTVLKDVFSDPKGLTWSKARMDGARAPGDDPAKQNLKQGQYQQRVIQSHRTVAFSGWPTDNVGADVEIRYNYNGHCVQTIALAMTSYARPDFDHGFSLDTDIRPAPSSETADVAAMEIEISRQFSSFRHTTTIVQRYVVFGDGREPVLTESTN